MLKIHMRPSSSSSLRALIATVCFLLTVAIVVTNIGPMRAPEVSAWAGEPVREWKGPVRSGAPGASIFSDGMMLRRRSRQRRYPVFIHIPKTGGTAVENIMRAEYDVKVGRFAFKPPENDKAGAWEGQYKTKGVPCARWHKPPKTFVPESFTLVRNPYARVISEFCYAPRFHSLSGKKKRLVHTEYMRIFGGEDFMDAMHGEEGETRRKTCDLFASYMVPALRKAVEAVRSGAQGQQMYTEYDCHLLPQSAYFKHAEWVIDLQSFDSVHDLLALYGLQRRVRDDVNENGKKDSIPTDHVNTSSERCTAYAFACMTDEVASLIEEFDADTFAFFGYSRDWRSLRPESL